MTLPALFDVQTLLSLPPQRYRYLDASVLLPGQEGDLELMFQNSALPGACRFRINKICEKADKLPHMVPGAAIFALAMTEMGISRETGLIFYDQKGSIGACRAHWMARLFGHECAHVLDGGLAAFERAQISVDSVPGSALGVAEAYRPRATYALLAGKGDVFAALNDPAAIVLDARNPARFYAQESEPRPGVRGGHMPGAINLPLASILDKYGCFLPPQALRSRFAACGVAGDEGKDFAQPRVITSCGSGLTAATLTMALLLAGLKPGQLYDGSWAEWGSDPATPVVI